MQNRTNKKRNARGFTLIEIVVALGILTIALASTLTLIFNVVDLAMTARDKTEATALAQKGLSAAAAACAGCNKAFLLAPSGYVWGTTQILDSGIEDATGHYATKYTGATIDGKTNYLILDTGFTQIADATPGNVINNANYIKIISRVDWSQRSIPYSTTIIQYVRRNQ